MAGTSYAGAVDSANLALNDLGLFIGLNRGTAPFGSRWNTTNRPAIAADLGGLISGPPTVDTLTDGQTSTENTYAGTTDDAVAAGIDWYEDLHILPRTTIDFGNIITQAEDEYEIYNAYRGTSIALDSIDESAVDPGIDLPEMTATYTIEPSASAFDSTTTANDGGTGLGTIVKLKVQALTDGIAVFDGDITFEDSGTELVTLGVSGSRIVFVPMEYEQGVRETLGFLTDVIPALSGKEQRIALRKNPRQLFEVTYRLSGNDRQRMQNLLMDWTDNVFGFPLQHEGVKLSAGTSIGATSFSTLGASEVDFRVGGLAVLFTDANTFDVITIDTVSDTTITSDDPVLNAYPAGTAIWPVRSARIVGAVPGRRWKTDLEEFRVTFEVTDNNTGALTGDVSAYSTYNSRTLFDGCNVVEGGTMGEEFTRRVHRIDNRTGLVDITSDWDRNKRSATKGFVLHDRAEILAFRRAMLSIRGRQKAFYIPTFIDDLEVEDDLTSGTATMDIVNIEYTRYAQNREPKRIVKVTFTDGTSQVNTVASSVVVDSDTERLTFDDNWATTKTVAEIERVEFYELVRFDSDNVNINYPRTGLASCEMPTIQVFDDNA